MYLTHFGEVTIKYAELITASENGMLYRNNQ